jgi:hypothetical protein
VITKLASIDIWDILQLSRLFHVSVYLQAIGPQQTQYWDIKVQLGDSISSTAVMVANLSLPSFQSPSLQLPEGLTSPSPN